MSIKSGLFGAITVILLIAVLGSGPVGDNLPTSGVAVAAGSIHAVFRWDLSGFSGTLKTAQYASLVVLVLATFVLGGLAGRARPLAAFIGGWGAAIGAAALAGMVQSLIAGDEAFTGASDVADRLYVTAGEGAGAMVWLGWLIGLAVMIGSFGKKQPKPAGAAAPPPGAYAPPQAPPPGAPPPGGYAPATAAAPPPPAAAPPPGAPAPAPAPAPISSPPPGAPDLAKPAPPPGAPGVASPPPAGPPPGGPSGPQIGPPPDRTQVYGQPPPQQ